ncbi:FAD-binding dehydrogenase [Bosea sp. UNC402CLCol]|uniref:FAD-binding dehydrogenase n=1 Tax=Bosea sp. UNC402CLCol TaxID=1510531 RepID=UPI00056E2B98|nr:FAD-binding dehydrogenase [Bosea sp. UNC402CLCol]
METETDVVIVGAGLSGLVAACEIADTGRKAVLLDQEPEASLGGQAFWSFGGLFFIDSPEQRRLRIRDSRELAADDWFGSAGFDRPEDEWPQRWAKAYLDFAAGEKRSWLHAMGMRWFPVVGWAERGGYLATGHGNSVPRFHVTWGTGPGVLEPFLRRAKEAEAKGLLSFRFRHRVTDLTKSGGAIDGVAGEILEPSGVGRGEKSGRTVAGHFSLKAQAVIVTSGGIGGNHELVRANWPERLGKAPARLLSGVPDHVDGAMLAVTEAAGGRLINSDRMWHYVEGIANWAPIWPRHAIRILPGPSSLWFDARGNRLPVPLFPGFDTLGTLEHIMKTGHGHSWFVLSRSIIAKEFALSGSEQNPDLTGKSWRQVLKRAGGGVPGPVQAFMDKGEDFIVETDFSRLVARMNALAGEALIDEAHLRGQIEARDRALANPFGKDMQVVALRGARAYLGDRLIRTAKPHRILDPAHGPLIAVRLNILTRKSLGGLMTDLSSRVLDAVGEPVPGLYAAGEAAGFGGGGLHGYRALEGTFLGGCIFSGRVAGRAAAEAVG